MTPSRFPDGFLWGAASSAYQVEGSPLADGAGPSNWHLFVRRRGAVRDGTTGDVACDHYHRYREDVQLMRRLGLGAYRFSVGWARIFPEPGRLNPKGLDFYQRLVDALLEAGIQPWLTVLHLEEPWWLARAGGFVNRRSVDHLVELGVVLFRTLGDRVKGWITVNEPSIHAVSGYFLGEFPPGRRWDLRGLFHCLHHLLLGHARLCDAWDSFSRGGDIGLAHHSLWTVPANPASRRDAAAADFMDLAANRSVLDPLLRGGYPAALLRRLGVFFPRTRERDQADMKRLGTYIGINYYTGIRTRWSPFIPFTRAAPHSPPGSPRSAMWEIHPEGIRRSLLRLREEYGNPPVVITENGFPLPDVPGTDPWEDTPRIAYLADHLREVARAIEAGAHCRGYFHWSLMDNFEWNRGLSMRFGLFRTNFDTQERSWKASARWYQRVVASNGACAGQDS